MKANWYKADFAAIKGMKGKAGKYGETIIKLLQEEVLGQETVKS
ncbi:MAG: hypothetical protein Q8M98_03810 [Candidatus Cloacimonadaceae bacterium]|nr:hypothetical protein [Candidatus Cloacimonadaceae bacterium]